MASLSDYWKIIAFIIFVFLYQNGGQSHKWQRAWLGPILLSITLLLTHKINVLTIIGSLSYLIASNGFSYGVKFTEDKLGLKILFRGLCGASYGACAVLMSLGDGNLILGLLNAILSISASIAFGVFNPFPSSWGNKATRAEDICISSSYGSILFF